MYTRKKINVGISAGILSILINTVCLADSIPSSEKNVANNVPNPVITSISAEIMEKLAENMGVAIFKLPSGAYKVTIKQKKQINEGLISINNANTYTNAIAKSGTANFNANIAAVANANTSANANTKNTNAADNTNAVNTTANAGINAVASVAGQQDAVSEEKAKTENKEISEEKAEKKEPPSEQIEPASGKGYVTGNGVNIRTGPGTDFNVIYGLNKGAAVDLLGKYDNWYKIKLSNGVIGWMCADYISNEPPEVSRGEEIANQIIDFAMQYMGVRYAYGGSTPSGFDCSGFTRYVYGNCGISIPRVAADQAKSGVYVDKSALMRGDLVFFDTNGGRSYINHVGIYIGNGQFIHASSGSGQVVISTLMSGFYANTYMTARRVIR